MVLFVDFLNRNYVVIFVNVVGWVYIRLVIFVVFFFLVVCVVSIMLYLGSLIIENLYIVRFCKFSKDGFGFKIRLF